MSRPSSEQVVARAREIVRVRNYSRRTAKAYCGWIVRFLRFNRGRDPRTLDKGDIARFLTYLANQRRVSALLFLCRHVFRKDIEKLDEMVKAKPSKRLPVVLTRAEVQAIID